VRAVARDPDAAVLPTGVEVVRGDLADPRSLEAHLSGVEAVFLLWPFTSPETAADLAPQVVEVIARNVPRIVYLSAQAATEQPDSNWSIVERAIEQSGTAWTFLRPTGFATNTLGWADQIRADGVVRQPYGDAARSLIDERDIAAVAVRALTEDGHRGARYVLTGPTTLTQAQQVQAIGAAIGRLVRWEELPREAARQELADAFGDAEFADTALDAWAGFVSQPETVTSTVQDITGAPAHTFGQWAAENAAAFR
jgi:uncharacterized protein YbjT (DUF2867 family)